jgi:hypothetical protein
MDTKIMQELSSCTGKLSDGSNRFRKRNCDIPGDVNIASHNFEAQQHNRKADAACGATYEYENLDDDSMIYLAET